MEITVTQYKDALIHAQDITPQHKKLLQIQYNLPDHKATATQLASMLGVKRWTVINLLYGKLGHILSDEINVLPLKHTKTGKYEWWRIIAEGQSTGQGFIWTLKPEFVQALEELQWLSLEPFFPQNCWWFGVNNKGKRDKSKPHVIYPEIQAFLSGHVQEFEWPYGGKPKSLYKEIRRGDSVIFWMGDGKYQKNWGILGFGRITEIKDIDGLQSRRYVVKKMYIPLKPITPYPSQHPQETEETELLKQVFGTTFKPLQKVFAHPEIGYIEKPSNIATTIEKISFDQYHILLQYAQEHDGKTACQQTDKPLESSPNVQSDQSFPSLTHTSFTFRSGCPPKISSTISVQAEKQVDISLRHNELQEMLYQELSNTYGEQNVGIEIESGIGTSIDLVVRQDNEYWFYEIKTEKSSRLCIRQALGQLLEYSLWPGSQEASRLIVVGEVKLDSEGEAYLSILRQKYALPLEYHQIVTR